MPPFSPAFVSLSTTPFLSHKLARSSFTPVLSRRQRAVHNPLVFPISIRPSTTPAIRHTPRAHTACSSASTSPCHSAEHDHAHEQATTNAPLSAFTALLRRITTLSETPRITVLSALALFLSAVVYLSKYHLLSRLLLTLPLTLSAFPNACSSLLMLLPPSRPTLNVHLLMTAATIILFFSGALFEAALLATLYAVSATAERLVSLRARRSLDTLSQLAPPVALRVPDLQASSIESVPVASVRVSDLLLIKVGEILPCDGVVAHGVAFISTPHLTGEATPRPVTVSQPVPAGSKVEDSPLIIRVTRTGADSSLARIARMVTEAQQNRPRITRFFDSFGERYTKIVFLTALFLAVFLPPISTLPFLPAISYIGKTGSLARALGVLVVCSPCGLLIGAPVAYLAALSACANRGVLVKSGAAALDAASTVRHVVFDKTGTLTTGNLTLTSVSELPSLHEQKQASNSVDAYLASLQPQNGLHELDAEATKKVVAAAAALERGAVHPIAAALQKSANDHGASLPDVSGLKVVPGQGVEGVLIFEDSRDLEMSLAKLGRPQYVLENHFGTYRSLTETAAMRGETVSLLQIANDTYLLSLRDELRSISKQLVTELRLQGYDITVLTGDASGAAKYVSEAVGGDVKVISEATPKEKLEYVTALQRKLGRRNSAVLMVGDGVNDAAALAASLVGMACGLSSATAVHAADVVLVREELQNVQWFLNKAANTRRIVKQNIFIALTLMVASSVACIGGALPLWLAVTLHEGSTVLVGMNALRLLRED